MPTGHRLIISIPRGRKFKGSSGSEKMQHFLADVVSLLLLQNQTASGVALNSYIIIPRPWPWQSASIASLAKECISVTSAVKILALSNQQIHKQGVGQQSCKSHPDTHFRCDEHISPQISFYTFLKRKHLQQCHVNCKELKI